MGLPTPMQVTVISQAEPTQHSSLMRMALFTEDGEAFVPLTEGTNVIAHQAVFAGADITALKVELNAFRTKLLASGLMAAE